MSKAESIAKMILIVPTGNLNRLHPLAKLKMNKMTQSLEPL